MDLSLSASGTPDEVRAQIRDQAETQLADAPRTPQIAVAGKVLEYVETLIPADAANVSVHASVSIKVTA